MQDVCVWVCVCHLQLSGGLSVEGALLGQLFVLLILQPFSYTDVVLHKLVLLDVGGIVLLNCEDKPRNKAGVKIISVQQ